MVIHSCFFAQKSRYDCHAQVQATEGAAIQICSQKRETCSVFARGVRILIMVVGSQVFVDPFQTIAVNVCSDLQIHVHQYCMFLSQCEISMTYIQ